MIEQTNEIEPGAWKIAWQAPTAEVLPVSETATSTLAGDDGNGSITGS